MFRFRRSINSDYNYEPARRVVPVPLGSNTDRRLDPRCAPA